MAVSEAELNKALKPFLKSIIEANVKMSDSDATRNVKIMEATVESLLTAMNDADPLFKELFQRKVYTGSFYDRIRVKNPTEFDLNMVLHLPFAPGDVNITPLSNAPAFMKFQLKRSVSDILSLHPKWQPQLYQKLLGFFDSNRMLLRNKIQRWIQSVISKAKTSFKRPPGVTALDESQSGPAFTYYIRTNHGTIDLDLVPVIACEEYSMPSNINKSQRFNKLPTEAKKWFLVPKPYTGPGVTNGGSDTYWRIAFPEAEKQLLKSEGCVKILVKLLKLLRDHQKWDKLYSYCIKTVFLLELDSCPDKSHWQEANLGTLFMKMLRKLKTTVDQRCLKYYFDQRANILNGLDASTSGNIASRMNRIIEDIQKVPSNVTKYFP